MTSPARAATNLNWRRTAALIALVLGISSSACSGDGAMGMAEYTGTVSEHVNDMNRTLDILLEEQTEAGDTIEAIRRHWDGRVVARNTFRNQMSALVPPQEAADLHATTLEIMTQLIEAESAIAARADTAPTVEELLPLEELPEWQAFLVIDDEAIALCRLALADIESPGEMTDFPDMPWIPTEMQDVVNVWFGCTAEDRGTGVP